MQIDIGEIIWNKPPWFRLTLQLFSSIEIHPLKMTFRYLLIKLFRISGFLTFKAIAIVEAKTGYTNFSTGELRQKNFGKNFEKFH